MRLSFVLVFLLINQPSLVLAEKDPRSIEKILFNVFLDKKQVGTHSFVIEQKNQHIWVESNMQLEGKFWGLVPFKYTHQSTEHWKNGCLINLQSQTLKRGKTVSVSARYNEAGLTITNANKAELIEGCIKSFAYWNSSALKGNQLLNTEDGKLVDVEIEIIHTQGVLGKSVVIRSSEADINLQYGADGKRLSLKSYLEVGGLLHYIRQ